MHALSVLTHFLLFALRMHDLSALNHFLLSHCLPSIFLCSQKQIPVWIQALLSLIRIPIVISLVVPYPYKSVPWAPVFHS